MKDFEVAYESKYLLKNAEEIIAMKCWEEFLTGLKKDEVCNCEFPDIL
jgi:hypothetical protein